MATATATPMTMTQKIIAIAVTIIIISTVALPIINDLQESIATSDNNTGYAYEASASGAANVSIIWLSSSSFSVNGTTYTPTDATLPVLVCDNLSVEWVTAGSYMQFNDMASAFSTHIDSDATTLTISSGSYTIGEDTGSVVGDVVSLSSNGDLGVYPSTYLTADTPVYVNKSSKIHMFGQGNVTNGGNTIFLAISLSGTLDNLVVTSGTNFTASPAASINPSDASAVFDSSSVVQKNKIAYAIQSSLIDVTYKSGGVNYTGYFYPVIFAPIEYKTLTDSDTEMINLISVIPIILILVPLMIAVRMIALRRN